MRAAVIKNEIALQPEVDEVSSMIAIMSKSNAYAPQLLRMIPEDGASRRAVCVAIKTIVMIVKNNAMPTKTYANTWSWAWVPFFSTTMANEVKWSQQQLAVVSVVDLR